MPRVIVTLGPLIVAGIVISSGSGMSDDIEANEGSIASGRDTNIFIGAPLNEEALKALAGRPDSALDDLARKLLSIRAEPDPVPAFCDTYGTVGNDAASDEYSRGMELLQNSDSVPSLKEAVGSFCKVIPVWATRNRRDWAWAQHNLGEALWRLALKEDDESAELLLQLAQNAVANASSAFSPSDNASAGMGWAWNEIMRGNVLISLAEIKSDHDLAQDSMEAYKEAERAAEGEREGDVRRIAQAGIARARSLLRSLKH